MSAPKRAIVDERAAHGLETAGRMKGLAPHEHAAASRRGGRALRGSFTQANG